MKIAVNGRFLTKPYTGIGQYTLALLKHLAKVDEENQYVIFVPERVKYQFGKNFELRVLPERKLGVAGMKKTWWEQIQVPRAMKEAACDVAWFPYPCNPWYESWYRRGGVRTLVTVHDCIPWKMKAYRPGVLSKMYNGQAKNSVKKADLVLTVSGESLKDIEKICGVPRKKIEVIYNDAADEYKEVPHRSEVVEVLKRFGLKSGEYFLYVGGYDQRKNVGNLLKEFSKYQGKEPLVLAGGKVLNKGIYKSYDQKGLDNVVKTGFLSSEELAILYRNCLAFVNLSQMEGFNLPIVEAANCGAAMILSDIPVHREVAEEAAIFVKEGEVLKALEKVKKESEQWQKNSKKLAQRYNWGKYAKMLKKFLTAQ